MIPYPRYDAQNIFPNHDFFAKFRLLLLLTLVLPTLIQAQIVNIGTPPIWNYSRKEYKAATQNWDATQDDAKIIYWANNDGVLRFDGTEWKVFPVANHTIVRSVAFDGRKRIYAGAQSELGYFSPDSRGQLVYTSITHLLPEGQKNFEDVWDIVFNDGDVFFRTNKSVFRYDGTSLKTFSFPGTLDALHSTGIGLLLQIESNQLLRYNGEDFIPYLISTGLQSAITGVIPWKHDTMLLTTLKNGIFYLDKTSLGNWPTPYDQLLREKRIYSAASLPNGSIAIGTSLDGLLVLNSQKQVFRHLNKHHGLQNNNVLHTFCDASGNVWLGLDNGIDCVVLDSKFTTLFPDNELQATAYAAIVHQDHLYLGVSNGGYVAPWQSYYDPERQPYFKRIENGEGQVWGFSKIEAQLMMGHHEGGFSIEGSSASHLTSEQGTWTFVQLSDEYMLAGTYTGLDLYKKQNGRWQYNGKINGINESCRIMVRDEDGHIWISHPYRGLYHVQWTPEKKYDPQIEFYDQQDGLPTSLNNYVFIISGKAVFGTEKGVFTFDHRARRFIPDPEFNTHLGESYRIRCMKEDAQGNIWYSTDHEVGVLWVDESGLKKEVTKQVIPELLGKLVGGFELIYPIDKYNVLFGAEEGFIHYDLHPVANLDTTLTLVFSSISLDLSQDSLLFGGYPAENQITRVLDAKFNSLIFSFTATEYQSPSLVEYRSKLDGLDTDWTSWTHDHRRVFTNLGAGQYTFSVQARIKDGFESNTISYSFEIRPPWYKSRTAYAMYAFGLLGIFSGFLFRQRKKFETEKNLMEITHQEKEAQHLREVELSKAALSEIQNEKLGVEIKFRNQELAMTTLHLVQKAEILLTVQEALNNIQNKNTDPAVKKDIQQLQNLLNFDVKIDEDWEHFAYYFDQVHVDFLKNLREQFPQLSLNDYKLCAYLRMNLSTKEIAPLLNISVRGVEGSRYRLRKKLGLPNDVNLTEFILGL